MAALVGRGRCNARGRVKGLCPDVRHRVGHQGRCGEQCPERRLQLGEEGLRLLLVLLQERLLQGLKLVVAKLIIMRDNNASNTGEDA